MAFAALVVTIGFGPAVTPVDAAASPSGTVPMGMSVKWIDITGLPSGDYFIKIIADPPWETGGRFLESNETNNRGWTRIHLAKTSVSVVSKSSKP